MADPEFYNSMADPNLDKYFHNKHILKHLKKAGLINRRGEIVSSKTYEQVLEHRARRRQAREQLSKNIVDYVLAKEKEYQAFVRGQFERAAQRTKIRKIQESRRHHRAVPGDLVAVERRPKTAVVESRATSEKRSPVRATSTHREPRSPTRAASAHFASHTKRNFVRRSTNERTKSEKRCQVTMIYYGPQMVIDHNSSYFQPYGDEIVVMQQHCGGENLMVFKGFRTPNDTFTFDSKRHPDYPFALALYVNGLIDSRISVCCECRHKKGIRIGGKQGQFGITNVKRGSPCKNCRFEHVHKTKASVAKNSIVIDPSKYRRSIVAQTPVVSISPFPRLLRTPSPPNEMLRVVKNLSPTPVLIQHSPANLRSSLAPSSASKKPASPLVYRSNSDELDKQIRSDSEESNRHVRSDSEESDKHVRSQISPSSEPKQSDPVISPEDKKQPDYDDLSLSMADSDDNSSRKNPTVAVKDNRPPSPSLSTTSNDQNQSDRSQTPIRQVTDNSLHSSTTIGGKKTDEEEEEQQQQRNSTPDSSSSAPYFEKEDTDKELEIPFESQTSSDETEKEPQHYVPNEETASEDEDDKRPAAREQSSSNESDVSEKAMIESPKPERDTVPTNPQKPATRRRRPLENLVLIWLDAMSENLDGDAPNTRAELRCVVHTLKTFTDDKKCIKFIQDNTNEKILLIISGNFSQEMIPLVETQPQLVGIYIFCENIPKYKQWANEHPKVKDAFNDRQKMCKRLKIDSKQWNNDLNTFISISPTINEEKNSPNLPFIYTQLFKEILIEMEYDDNSKEKFIGFCKSLCAKNPEELVYIEEFEKKYQDHPPVWWYTTDCLAYQMLNRAIRTQDITNVVQAGFFLRDLHEQLKKMHTLSSNITPFTVYRGQGMEKQSFEELQKNRGGLLSFNGFLSTSTEKKSL